MTVNWKNISLKDLAGYISEELRKKGIETVLVGGACVSIYTNNRYQSYDLDFVSYQEIKEIKVSLLALGFREVGRYFKHSNCPWIVEFVPPPVAIGEESIKKFHLVKTRRGTIKLLRPTDSAKDRLASYYYWDDKEGLEQALYLCKDQKIDLKEIKRWSLKEKQEKKYQFFLKRLKDL